MGRSRREHMTRQLETDRFCLDEILLKRIIVQSSGAFGVGQRQRAGNELSHSVFIKGLFPSWRPRGSNHWPLDYKASTLPLHHVGPNSDKILLKRIFVQSSGAFGVGQRQRAGNALSHSVFVNGDQRWRMKVVPNEKWFQYTIYYVVLSGGLWSF